MDSSETTRGQASHNFIVNLSGGDSEGDPPVPIPNTEVKPFSADDTWGETPWESRSLPVSIYVAGEFLSCDFYYKDITRAHRIAVSRGLFFSDSPSESDESQACIWVGLCWTVLRDFCDSPSGVDGIAGHIRLYPRTIAGEFDQSYTFRVRERSGEASPYTAPNLTGLSSTFEFSRMSVPNPSMLPSWNQIGFDSLHYIAGTVAGEGDRSILWVIGGKLENGETVVDPSLEARFPLIMEYDGGLVTLYNYDGFKINFIGSWDMPFDQYRIAAQVDDTGQFTSQAAITAAAMCDEIKFYGTGLKLMGMSEFDTGKMTAYGGLNLEYWGDFGMPEGVGEVVFSREEGSVSAVLEGTRLKAGEHVYSILLVDANGNPLPLYYTKNTSFTENADGTIQRVSLTIDQNETVSGKVKAYLMVDTYPVAQGELLFE